MKKIIVIIVFLASFLGFSQENNSNLFNENNKSFYNFNFQETNYNYKPFPKNYFSELQDNFTTLNELQSNLPKLNYGKQTFFYTKDEFTGFYNIYSSVNNEVRLYQSHFSILDFSPTCGMPGPVSNGDAGDLVGAIIHSLLSDLDLKFKIGKRHTISFF